MIVARKEAEKKLGKELRGPQYVGKRWFLLSRSVPHRNLGGFATKQEAKDHERAVQYFKRNPEETPVPPSVRDRRLWLRQRAKVKKRVDVWPSAYASGQVTQEYKRAGGRYYNPSSPLDNEALLELELAVIENPSDNPLTGLDKWFAEEWVDLARSVYLKGDKAGHLKPGGWVKCGRPDTTKGGYPKCRPLAEAKKMTPKQRIYAIRKKRKAERKAPDDKGRAPIMVKTYKGKDNPSGLSKDVRKLLRGAEQQGCVVFKGRKHYKVRCPEGPQITVSSTPSDRHVLHKIRKDFRRAGVHLNPDGSRAPNPSENPERKKLYIYPNKSAVKVAKRALERRKKLPKSKRGGLDAMEAHEQGIGSGVLRARDIAAGKRINAYQVKAFFDRHRSNFVKAKSDGKKWEDSKAWQAWDLWGGEPLRKQVEKAVEKDKREREGEAKKNPYRKERFEHEGIPAGLKESKYESWGDWEARQGMYTGPIPPDPAVERKRRAEIKAKAQAKLKKLKGNPDKAPLAKDLIAECRALWESYCERPGKVKLLKVERHCDVMKDSKYKTVKDERRRCMNAVRREKKKLGM